MPTNRDLQFTDKFLVFVRLGHGLAARIEFGFTILTAAIPLLLKVSGSLTLARETLFSSILCLMIWLSYVTGGVYSPAIYWIAVLPSLALLLAGVRCGLIWSIVSLSGIAGISLLDFLKVPLGHNPIVEMRILAMLSSAGLVFTIASFSLLFKLNNRYAFNELHQALNVIGAIAITDELTGIYNRRQLLKLIEDAKSRHERSALSFCLCVIDIDNFKIINDTLGHKAGDEVLKRLATTIQTQIRKTDCFGRYGGEEFLLLLEGANADLAVLHAERVRQRIEGMRFPELPEGKNLTISVGVAEYCLPENVMETIARAEMALYAAKREGRNCVANAANRHSWPVVHTSSKSN